MRLWLSLAAVALGTALLAGALLLREDGAPAAARVQVAGSLPAGEVPFGDTVPGVVEAVVPRELVDPATVRLEASFAPWSVQGRIHRRRFDSGGTTLVRWTFDLWCVRRGCLPGGRGDGDFSLAPAQVRWIERNGTPRAELVAWPAVSTATRLGPADTGFLGWRAQLNPPPELTYDVPPLLAAGFLVLVALGLLAAGAILFAPAAAALASALRRPADASGGRSVLERALAAVRAAAAGDDSAERRRALDLLARELRAGRRRGAGEARELAWSETLPARGEMEQLADRVEGTGR